MIKILRQARDFISRPDSDFGWSTWEDKKEALSEIDGLIKKLEAGELPPRDDLEILFLPTGPLQEVSISSGWGEEFLMLANKFDDASRNLYGRHPRELQAHREQLKTLAAQIVDGSPRARWFFSGLLVLTIGMLVYNTCFDKEPAEVYFPVHLKGVEVTNVLVVAAILYALLSALNWRSWSKKRSGK